MQPIRPETITLDTITDHLPLLGEGKQFCRLWKAWNCAIASRESNDKITTIRNKTIWSGLKFTGTFSYFLHCADTRRWVRLGRLSPILGGFSYVIAVSSLLASCKKNIDQLHSENQQNKVALVTELILSILAIGYLVISLLLLGSQSIALITLSNNFWKLPIAVVIISSLYQVVFEGQRVANQQAQVHAHA